MESDLTRRTVKQLKDTLRSLGLKVSGNKPDLIQRILQAEHEITPQKQVSPQGKFPTGIIDIDREILLNLNIYDLSDACKTNKYAIRLCADDDFLRLRLQRNYEDNATKALTAAVTHGDLVFVKYLVKMHNVSLNYSKFDDYSAFERAHAGGYYGVIKYLTENTEITIKDLYDLVKQVINDEDVGIDVLQYIIEESGIVHKLIGLGRDLWDTYVKLTDIAEEKEYSNGYGYLTMMRYLYETLDKSTYLNVLTTISKNELSYPRHYGYA